MVVHTCGRFLVVIAGGRLCRCIHDAGPLLSLPFVALVICGRRMLVVFVCSWYSYVHGPSGGVVMEP